LSSYLKNKNILVTGGSKGIGEEICFFLLKQNCIVYTVARNNIKSQRLKKYLEGGSLYFYKLNLLNDKDFSKFLKKVGNINFDIIINNIGGGLGIKNIISDFNKWYKVWKFNVGIAIKINNYFIKKMKIRKSGKIIHISSTASIDGGPAIYPYGGSPPYACSKAFLNMYVKTLSRELKEFNISISAILPGPILVKGKHWFKLKMNNVKLFNRFIKEHLPTGQMLTPYKIIPTIKALCEGKRNTFNSPLIRIYGNKKINKKN